MEDLVAKALSHAQGQLEGKQPHFNTLLPSHQHHQPHHSDNDRGPKNLHSIGATAQGRVWEADVGLIGIVNET